MSQYGPLIFRFITASWQGTFPDTRTISTLLSEFAVLGFSKVRLVMDRGFYSEGNINALFKVHLKFLISAKMLCR